MKKYFKIIFLLFLVFAGNSNLFSSGKLLVSMRNSLGEVVRQIDDDLFRVRVVIAGVDESVNVNSSQLENLINARGETDVVINGRKARIISALKQFNSVEDFVKNISENRISIRKLLYLNEGKEYAKKYFNKFVKEGNFEDWYNNVFKKVENNVAEFEAHHVIPVKVLEGNPRLQELLFKFHDKFKFNDVDNGIPIQKKKVTLDQNGHANHPNYNRYIRENIDEILNHPRNLNNSERAFDEIQEFIKNIKSKLENDVLLGNKDVDQIFNF